MTWTRTARWALAGATAASLGWQAGAEDQAPPPASANTPALRATLKLVQVDAVVTDNQGRHVSDLVAGDFELREDGKLQEISNCAFIPIGTAEETPGQSAAAPAGQARRADVQRTIALVVDDLALDLQSLVTVRNGLATFVEKQIQPGDLVSVIRTGGAGVLQQFTTDKGVLRASIDRVRFSLAADVDAFEPLNATPVLQSPHDRGVGSVELARLRDSVLTGGAISALEFVLAGLKDLPGRKSVVLFSKGYPLYESDGARTAFGSALPGLIDLANRASVVIYTVDTLGVPTGQLTAADNTNNPEGTADPTFAARLGATALTAVFLRGPTARFLTGLDGLEAISDATGGLLLRGQNDPSVQLGRVLEDQKGYYLIGYVPPASTFKTHNGQPALHRIKLAVNRKGLTVRARSRFYGVADDDPHNDATRDPTTLASTLMSPFSAGAVGVRLNALFFHDKVRGDLLHSFLHVDPDALTLDQGADGISRARVEIQALTFDADGQVADQLHRFGEVTFSPERRDKALRHGIGYVIDVPVQKPGAYQVRVAVRDTASGRVGSAYEFVRVPDVDQGLSLSGILMTDATLSDEPPQTGPDAAEAYAADALRVFAPGRPVAYGLTIYNPQVGRGTGQVQLATRVRLLRDGCEIVASQPLSVDAAAQSDTKAIFAGGALLLPPNLEEGDYVFQVTVTDTASPAQPLAAVQTAELEIRR